MKKLAQLTLVFSTLVSSFAFAEMTTEISVGDSKAKVTLVNESSTPIQASITAPDGSVQSVTFTTLKFVDEEVDLIRVNEYTLSKPEAKEASVKFEVEYSVRNTAFIQADCVVSFENTFIDMVCEKK